MKGRWLLAAGAVVAALLVGLLALTQASHAPAPSPATTTTEVPASASAPSPSTTPAARRPAPTPSPDAPASATTAAPSSGGSGRPRADVTHDHRGEGPVGPPSPIIPDTVAAIRRDLTPLVKACGQKLPAGQKARVIAVVRATSTAGKVAHSDIRVKVQDGEDPALVDCVTKAFEQAVIDAPTGQGDASYKLAMPFDLP